MFLYGTKPLCQGESLLRDFSLDTMYQAPHKRHCIQQRVMWTLSPSMWLTVFRGEGEFTGISEAWEALSRMGSQRITLSLVGMPSEPQRGSLPESQQSAGHQDGRQSPGSHLTPGSLFSPREIRVLVSSTLKGLPIF